MYVHSNVFVSFAAYSTALVLCVRVFMYDYLYICMYEPH